MPKTEPNSIREALDQAYDEQLEPVEVETVEEVVETKSDRVRSPDGKFAKVEEAVVPVEVIEPEDQWSDPDKNAFRAIPPEHRKWVMERYKRIESDHTKKSMEAAELRKYREQIDKVLEPYRTEIKMQGMDEVGAIQNLFSIRDHLRKDPIGGFKWLANQFGVDLNQLIEQSPEDPAAQAVNQIVQKYDSKLSQIEQTIQQDRMNAAWARMDAFAQEKDAAGRLKFPHFEAVVDSMAQLMKAGIVPMGDLEKAYDNAVRLKPELSTPAPVAQVEAPKVELKTDELDKAQKAAKAKKAAASVSGGADAATDRKMTLREELQARLDGSLH